MFKHLGGLLPDALNRMKVRKPVEAGMVCQACDRALGDCWDHAVPMRAVTFRGGVVTVAVTSSGWGHEVLTRAEQLKETINRELGGAPVRQVKTRVAPTAARGSDIG